MKSWLNSPALESRQSGQLKIVNADLRLIRACFFKQALMEQQRKMDKRQNELKKYLATVYEDKVTGVMNDETFVLLSNQFKRERNELKEAQQRIQTEFETAQKFQDGLARFKKEVKGQTNIKFLTRDIVGQFIDWIAVYPEDRDAKPYSQKIEIHYHFIGKIEEIL